MITVKPENDVELRRPLQRLIYRPGLTQAEMDQQIRALLRHVNNRDLSLEHCLAGKVGDDIVECCLCIDSPGSYFGHLPPDLDS